MLNRRQLIVSGSSLLFAGAAARSLAQEATPPDVSSTRYVSMNADTGAIFAQEGAHDQVAIASLTKVFTAMEALERAPLDTVITTSEDDFQPAEATVMGFGAGETFTLEELIYGMMLPSGNDAAYAIARSLGHQQGDSAEESVQRFMDQVNERVLAMGLENTHLLNPDGWGVPGHYSSAADVAAFMSYASTSNFLIQVMGTHTYTTRSGYVLVNTNRALTTAPSVLAGKTGYDNDSGWCLVQLAQRDNTRIVAVTLDGVAPDIWYNDNLLLLDYGFDQQTALGPNPFEGDTMAWADPAPVLFAQAGSGEAAIAGQTEDDEIVVTREETAPRRAQQSTAPEEAVKQPDVEYDGKRSSGVLAGIGGAILAGSIGVIRWTDFGGDRTGESIGSSLRATNRSLRRGLPLLSWFSRDRSSEEPTGDDGSKELESNLDDDEYQLYEEGDSDA